MKTRAGWIVGEGTLRPADGQLLLRSHLAFLLEGEGFFPPYYVISSSLCFNCLVFYIYILEKPH